MVQHMSSDSSRHSTSSISSIADFNWSEYPEIQARRDWSLEQTEKLRGIMSDICQSCPAVRSVIVSGSLARLDAGPNSDIDVIVVMSDDTELTSSISGDTVTEISRRCETLGLRSAQATGIFASPTSRSELCDGPRGIVNESMAVFGKRMQLLLEARPIFGINACRDLQSDILQRYLAHPFSSQSHEHWSYLTDDLIRYWRSYRVWRHWDIEPSNGGWYLRNLKLRNSRLLSYASLLLSCATANRELNSVLDVLSLTPLERLAQLEHRLEHRLETKTMKPICEAYDCFLRIVNDSESRRRLEDIQVDRAETAMQTATTKFEELLASSRSIQAALVTLLSRLPNQQAILSNLLF